VAVKADMNTKVRVSLVVHTFNEEADIGDCLRSAGDLADEVLVTDMSSTDRTAEIARSLGARVSVIPKAPFVDPVRNQAIAQASGDWILLLDADERLTPELSAALRAVAGGDEADVVETAFEVYMFGERIRYTGWQDIRKKIFFRKGFLTFPDTEVHAQPAHKGRLLFLPPERGVVKHYNYRDIRHFILKLNDYTGGEALKLLKAGGKMSPLRGIYWGVRHFFRRYVLRAGYRDGAFGFMLSVFMGFYWFLAFCKAWELQRARRGEGR